MNKILISLICFAFLVGLSGVASAQPTVAWTATYDSGGIDVANGVAVDSGDNVIVTGYSSSWDYYTIKYDSNGNQLWNVSYDGGSYDKARGVAVDSNNNVIVTGYSYLGGNYDYYTIKYDSSGNPLWNVSYDSGGSDYAYGVAVDSSDNVIVTGRSWTGFLGYMDYYTIKYDSNGNLLWNVTYDGGSGDGAYGVAVDSSDNVIVTGNSEFGGNADYYTIKYDSNGNLLWNVTYDGGSHDYAHGVAVDSNDNVIVTGNSSLGGNADYYTIKYAELSTDSDGDGVPDDQDSCPTTPGKPEYQGCPVGDENLVELHVIDRTKSYCGGAGSCKELIEGALVRVFDRNDADFQSTYGTKNPSGTIYDQVFENDIGRVGACTTDSSGRCIAGEETTGDYLVIVKYTDIETGKVIYTGKPKSPGDFVDTDGDGSGDLAYKDFQVIKVIKKDGSIDFKAGSKTVITGSYLEVIHPQYVIWENNETLYPFIFTSDSDWEVDVCVYVPEGYMVADGECTQAFVTNETKDILFTVVETSSPEPNFKATIKTKRKGKVKKVDIDMPGKRTKKYLEAMEKGKGQRKGKGTPAAAGILGLIGATMTLAIVLQRRK